MPKPVDEPRPDEDQEEDPAEEESEPAEDSLDEDPDDDLDDEDDVEKLREKVRHWRASSRKHERRDKTNFKELEKLRRERLSDQERAVEDARAEGEKDGSRKAAVALVPEAFRLAVGDRIPEKGLKAVLDGIDPTKFLGADNTIDVDRISAYVDGIAPVKGGSGWPDTGGGARQRSATDGLSAGRETARRRHGVKTKDD